jgi:hypothetical protein
VLVYDGLDSHFLPTLPQTKEDVHDGPVFVMGKVRLLLLLLLHMGGRG